MSVTGNGGYFAYLPQDLNVGQGQQQNALTRAYETQRDQLIHLRNKSMAKVEGIDQEMRDMMNDLQARRFAETELIDTCDRDLKVLTQHLGAGAG